MKLRLIEALVCPEDRGWPFQLHLFEDRAIETPHLPEPEPSTGVVCKFYCARKGIKLQDPLATELQAATDKETDSKSDNDKTALDIAKTIDYTTDCKECLSREIVAGMLECPTCGTFYPIIEEIALILSEELRNEDIERTFTNKWAAEIGKLLKK